MGEPDPDIAGQQLRKFQKELSGGTVALVLLAVLEAAREPMYGYQIAKRLERFGDGVLSGKQSALYPVLRNLGAAGLLDSPVEPSISGPPRRYYRITVTGRAALHEWSAATPGSEERPVGKECGRTGNSQGDPNYHKKKK